jgi:hypothetical protein
VFHQSVKIHLIGVIRALSKRIKMKKLLTILLIIIAAKTQASNNNVFADTSEIAKAHSLVQQVIEEGRFINSFAEAISITLPQGIKKSVGERDFIIVIESIEATKDGAKLTMYASLEVPGTERKLAFRGKDIDFSPGGFSGGGRLELMGDQNVPLGENMLLVVKGPLTNNKTYVECDCNGYKSMSLQGEIQFSREKLIPIGPDGKDIENKSARVTAPFETSLVGWDDFMLEVGITPFRVKDMKDFSFSVTSAVFDFSEVANAPSMTFPEGYESSDFIDGNRNMWKGFFLKDLIIKLPPNFNEKDTTQSSIEAHNLIIDNIGLSGQFKATNILSLEKGRIGKWAFSLDEINAEITKNQLVNCGFKGEMNVPPLGDSTILGYEAFIDPANQYTFIVSTGDTINMSIWAAHLELHPNSYVDISVIEGKFRPKAVLNGKLAVKTKKVELADVEFEELTITPEVPYIKAEKFSFGSEFAEQKLGNFPIAITDIGMTNVDDRTGLKFNLKLNLVKESSGGFAGETGLTLFAKSYEENERQRWKYDGLEVHKIAIDIDQGAFKLKGSAQFYKNDQVYGDGFSGNIEAEFSKLPKLSATAIFGNVGGLRYFYADAMANFNSGLPVFGGLYLYGLGGGIYHHMSQLGWDEKAPGTIGQTASGIIYKPDKNTLFGFKATVAMGLKSKELFNGDLTFEMAFNNSCGVNLIALRGNGYFMTPPEEGGGMDKLIDKTKDIAKGKDPNDKTKKDKDPGRSSLYAYVDLRMDFQENIFHGVLGTYINLPGGILQGIGPGGKAGEAVIHFAKDEWYIWVGTPTDRFGLKALNFAQLDAYFVMGTKIPASPPPPAKVSEILGGIDLDYMANENAIGEGKGIGFGAGLQISTGRKTLGPFYAEFDAGAGFDVMLKNYGNVFCKGQSSPLGVNGWYANGQVWAYLEGAIGIKVNLRFIKGQYEILRVGAAAVLQAKLPNPFWMRGTIGGRYRILGGLVSGECSFQFEIGEECEIVGDVSPVQNIQVIAEATPNDGATDVNVFNAPQALFNMPIDKEFKVQDMDGNKLGIKIELDHFRIKDGNNIIQGKLEWNSEMDVVAFNSFEVLPPEKKLELEVQVSFKEYKNNKWQTLMANGQKVIENLITTFTTGKAPDIIPMNNILYCYPIPMMFNYYQNETDIGYIQLEKGQAYLFNPGPKWKQIGRFVDKQGNKHEFNFNYNIAEKKVSFIRPGNLKNNTIYSFELVNVPAQAKGAIDKNVTAKVNKKELVKDNESTLEIKTKEAEGALTILDEKKIFETHFRTSLYNTFILKVDNLQKDKGNKWMLQSFVHLLYIGIDDGEIFDDYEVNGSQNIMPIIQFENNLENKTWYKPHIYPYLYENYPLANTIRVTLRNEDPIGVPPIHTMKIGMVKNTRNLNENDIKYGASDISLGASSFQSSLVKYASQDYGDLATQVAARYWSGYEINSKMEHIITYPFQAVKKGDYKFKIQYTLPGLSKITSSKELVIVID